MLYCSSSWLGHSEVSTARAHASLFKTWEVWEGCDLSPVCNRTPLLWIQLCSNEPEKLVKSASQGVPEDLVSHWSCQAFVYCFPTEFCTRAATSSPWAVEVMMLCCWGGSKPILHPTFSPPSLLPHFFFFFLFCYGRTRVSASPQGHCYVLGLIVCITA